MVRSLGFDAQSESVVHSVMSDSLRPHRLQPARLLLQTRILEWLLSLPSPEALPNPGIEPRSPVLQANALPSELLEKAFLKGVAAK